MDSQSQNHTQTQSNENQQALWASFESSSEPAAYLHDWLALQCSRIGSVSLAVLVLENEEGFSPCALYPDGARDSQRLADLIERTLEQGAGLWLKMKSPAAISSLSCYALSYPLKVDAEIKGVVVIELSVKNEADLGEAMQKLRWGMGWLKLSLWQQRAMHDQKQLAQLQPAMELLQRVLAEAHFDAASLSLVSEMAKLFNCERVSLGIVERDKIKVQALSHSARFAQQMNLMRLISAAMEETFDQRQIIHWPDSDQQQNITRNHERLAAEDSSGAILSLPLSFQTEDPHSENTASSCYGILLLERAGSENFSVEEKQSIKKITALLAPMLDEKYRLDAPLTTFIRQRYQRRDKTENKNRIILSALLLLTILFFSVVKDDYLLNADAQLEGAVQRVVAAPFNGFIDEAPARAGDNVGRDDLLVRLDDRDLRLERIKWLSERTRLQKQSQDARARRQRAEVTILESQIAQSTAELQLVESQLERTYLSAPFDGLIVSGDLSQRLGGAVQQGEVLFEIAPLQDYRLILQVDEARITDVKLRQQGELVLTALPNQHYPFLIEKITPVASAAEGLNRFRVEARLLNSAEQLRPGMKGIGKISIDERLLISIWTRNLREWLSLQYWRWLG